MKNNKYILVTIIVMAIILLIGSSYALLRSSQRGDNVYTMTIGTLEVSFLDQETDSMVISNMYPMTDEEGLAQDDSGDLTFTVQNTGSLRAIYNIYIEETSTTPEFKTVIRYVSKKEGFSYANPKTLSEDNYIEKEGVLEPLATATYNVKAWLAENAGNEYMTTAISTKTFTARIIVESIQDLNAADKVLAAAREKETRSGCKTTLLDNTDGIMYLSGSNECIDFNYVWWSGILWRVVAVYPDESIKMVTENNLTTIAFNAASTPAFYNNSSSAKSYAFQWLNEDFLDTLYNNGEDIIDDTKYWNEATVSDYTIKPAEAASTLVSTSVAPVGLLNTYEYYMSHSNVSETPAYTNGYLFNGFPTILINRYSGTQVWYTDSTGLPAARTVTSSTGMRPTVILKSDVSFSGNGTKTSPFLIDSDYSSAAIGDRVNTRHTGEYIKFSETNDIYRIVAVENDTTRVISTTYAETNTLKRIASGYSFGASGNTQTDTYWDYYLNNTWINSLPFKDQLTTGDFYRGLTGDNATANYKTAICSTNTSNPVSTCTKSGSISRMVGLSRIGEMFSTQKTKDVDDAGFYAMWTITRYGTENVKLINSNGTLSNVGPTSQTAAVRPIITLKSNVKIASGTGLSNDPYVIPPFGSYTVTYNSSFIPFSDGTYENSVIYDEDTTNIFAGVEETLTNDCNTFTGWYLDRDRTIPYDINEHINEDVTVYAGYENNTFCYTSTGAETTFIAFENTSYTLELWGSKGRNSSNATGGYGGYSVGTATFSNKEKLYINIGGAGSLAGANSTYVSGGYNGGGNAAGSAGGGGGATHIAFSTGLLTVFADSEKQADLIIVAGGGGGAGAYNSNEKGGSGGGSSAGAGGNNSSSYKGGGAGGTQATGGEAGSNGTTAGVAGSFGKGGRGGYYSSGTQGSGGGGGGFYGGGGGSGRNGGGGGGSGYLNTSLLTNYGMWCYTGCSGDNTTVVSTYAAHETQNSNSGAGYVKITVN